MLKSLYQSILNEFATQNNYPKFSFKVVHTNQQNSDNLILRISFPHKADAEEFVEILFKHGIYSLASKPAKKKKPIQLIDNEFCAHLQQNEVDILCDQLQLSQFKLVLHDSYNESFDINNHIFHDKNISNQNSTAVDIFQLNINELQQHVQWLIRHNQAVVKVIKSKFTDIDFNLNQLADPTLYRPSRVIYYGRGKSWAIDGNVISKINPLTGLEDPNYIIGSGRKNKLKNNPAHTYSDTAKTSVTCLSSVPEAMQLCDNYTTSGVLILFDRLWCNDKDDKYSWFQNAGSNELFYLNRTKSKWLKDIIKDPYKQSVTIDKIIEHNEQLVAKYRSLRIVGKWNELLYGLPERHIEAIGVRRKLLEDRLFALKVMYRAKAKLKYTNYEPAMFNLIADDKFSFYQHADRLNDVIQSFSGNHDQEMQTLMENNYELLTNIVKSAFEANQKIDQSIKDELANILQKYQVPINIIFVSKENFKENIDTRKKIFSERYALGDLTYIFNSVKTIKCENLLAELIEIELSESVVSLNNPKLNLQLFKFLMENNFYRIVIKLIQNTLIPIDKIFITDRDKEIFLNYLFTNKQIKDEELTTICLFALGNVEVTADEKVNEVLSILNSKFYDENTKDKIIQFYLNQWKELPIKACIDNGEKVADLLRLFLNHGVHKCTNAELNEALRYLISNQSISSLFNIIQIITSYPNFKIENNDEFIELFVKCTDPFAIDAMLSNNNIKLFVLENKNKIIALAYENKNESLCAKILYKSLETKKVKFEVKDSLLHLSLLDEDENIIKLFADHDMYQQNLAGNTPLLIALTLANQDQKKYANIVKLIITKNQVVIHSIKPTDKSHQYALTFKSYCETETENNLLHHLMDKEELRLFQFFCKIENCQIDPRITDNNGHTILQRALAMKNSDYATSLLENISILSMLDDQQKNDLLFCLVQAAEFKLALLVIKSIKYLFYQSNSTNNINMLHTLAEWGDDKNKDHTLLLLNYLLKLKDKSIVNQLNQNNETVMSICIRKHHYAFAKTIFLQTYKQLNHEDIIDFIHFTLKQDLSNNKDMLNIFKLFCELNLSLLSTTNNNPNPLLVAILNYNELINICFDTILQQLNSQNLAKIIDQLLDARNNYKNISQPQKNERINIAYNLLEKCKIIDLSSTLDQNDYTSLLHRMVLLNDLKAVKLICEKSLQIDHKDINGESAFILAAKMQLFNLIDIFLALPNKLSNDELNLMLICAAKANKFRLAKQILELDNINFRFNNRYTDDKGNTALHYLLAIDFRQSSDASEIIEILIQRQAFLDLPNAKSITPLEIAIDNYHISENIYIYKVIWDRLIVLINSNNCDNKKLLGILALRFCQLQTFELAVNLLNKVKADLTLTDGLNQSVLSYAVAARETKLIDILTKHGIQTKQFIQAYTDNNLTENQNTAQTCHNSIKSMAAAGFDLPPVTEKDINDIPGNLAERRAFGIRAIQKQLENTDLDGILKWAEDLDNNNQSTHRMPEYISKRQGKFPYISFFGHQWNGKELSATGALALKIAKNEILKRVVDNGKPIDPSKQAKIENFLKSKRQRFNVETKSSDIYNSLWTTKHDVAKQKLKLQQEKTEEKINKIAPLGKK